MNYRVECVQRKDQTRYVVRKYNGDIVNNCYHEEKRAAEKQCSLLNAFFDNPEKIVEQLKDK